MGGGRRVRSAQVGNVVGSEAAGCARGIVRKELRPHVPELPQHRRLHSHGASRPSVGRPSEGEEEGLRAMPEDRSLKAHLTVLARCLQLLKDLTRIPALTALTATSCTTTQTFKPYLLRLDARQAVRSRTAVEASRLKLLRHDVRATKTA